MASFVAASSSTADFDGEGSFYNQIMALRSRHKESMADKLYYKVYVHSPFVNHHLLVLVDKEEYSEHVTIELTITDISDGDIKPKSRLYSDGLEGLSYKGKVYCSLEHLCEIAYGVLANVGSYNLAFNNCQHFCNKVLKELGLSEHTTDTTTIGIGAAVGAGIFLAGYGLYRYLSNNDDSRGKEKKK